jgi:imidazolonepropionase
MQNILIKNIKGLGGILEGNSTALRGDQLSKFEVLEKAYLAIEDGKIADYGKMEDLEGITNWANLEVIDADGKFVLPAFCDSHTHIVFAATREGEFVDRINGLTYEEIGKKGGGILNSARKLADMSEEDLITAALKRLELVKSFGTGAIEIKSGYGLSVEAELKMLRVIRELKKRSNLTIKATFLGAHAFPIEYKENQDAYVDLVINEMLPQIQKENLADYIDVFCERNYFTPEQLRSYFGSRSKSRIQTKNSRKPILHFRWR